MIKTFISHTGSDHPFVNWLNAKLSCDGLNLDVFVDDEALYVGDTPQKMIDEVKASIIFIPVLSDESVTKEFVQNEIKTALESDSTHIFPIIFKCKFENIPEGIKNRFAAHDSVAGYIWDDFSNAAEWELKYEDLRKGIANKLVELGLGINNNVEFYQDCEHLDLIINRQQPTSREIKIIIDVYLKKESYRSYFYERLSNPIWLKYLIWYGQFNFNPHPIESVDSPGYFSIPHWPILDYLEKMSAIGDPELNAQIVQIILKVTQAEKVDNYRTWWVFVKCLLNIPNSEVTPEIIDLIPVWLQSNFSATLADSTIATELLPKFLSDTSSKHSLKKAEKIIAHITSVNKENGKLCVEPYWLEESFKKHASDVGKWLSNAVINSICNNLKIILGDDKKPYRAYHSFYEEPAYHLTDPLDVLIDILKKVLIAKASTNIDAAKDVLRKLFRQRHLIFPKLALYVVGSCDGYIDLLWEFIAVKPKYFGADDIFFSDEIKHIFLRLRQLTPAQKTILQTIIEKGPKERDRDNPELEIAFWKQQRYGALSAVPEFLEEYNRLKLVTGTDAEMAPAIGPIKSGWVSPGESPLKYEEMLSMPNVDIARHLSEFRQQSRWDGPTFEGLAQSLRELAKQHPEKLTADMQPFHGTSYRYIYEMLRGFLECWNSKKSVNWRAVFGFLKQYMEPTDFWSDAYKLEDGSWNAGHGWIVGQTAEIIQSGNKDRSWEFDVSLLPEVQEFLLWILSRTNEPDEEDEAKSDPITYSLNTPSGKLIIALIYLSLRLARLDNENVQSPERRWKPELREAFSQALAKNTIEAYVFLGEYLPNIFYLDNGWTREVIRQFETLNNSQLWSCFMYGYLYSNHVYDELYRLMKANYERAYSFEFAKKEVKNRLIQHLALGYLRGNESLETTCLFGKLIHDGNLDSLKEVVDFFWMQRRVTSNDEPHNQEVIAKVINFWKLLYERYLDRAAGEYSREEMSLLSHISRLAVFLPQIDDENSKWLLQAIPFANVSHYAYSVIEELDALKDKGDPTVSAGYIGLLYLAMLDSFTPDYDKEHIRSIVAFLYEHGNKEAADKICNIYGVRGMQFLRDIYERYNT
ncbi:toll/interleukin-1 receptor domain-containing protein [Trichlorobacter lovleyi]|uniref:toll/interleukin-1 receptor domain-containing protein n=1 Tax=Trichlorobacter lovleyi TaxID=313985 RepID=UPI0023F0ACFB|nr:toll/interleukin-1 receptor domain-containing protein [Trichlorobacter lovleyi]